MLERLISLVTKRFYVFTTLPLFLPLVIYPLSDPAKLPLNEFLFCLMNPKL